MKTKRCSRCKKVKPISKFGKRLKGTNTYCIECNRVVCKERYQRNKEQHIAYVRDKFKEKTERFALWKSEQGCIVCGEDFPKCLDMHHLGEEEKEIEISTLLNVHNASWERIMEEASKCVVVCKNCHVKVHEGLIELDGV